MIEIQEIRNEYNTAGIITKSAVENFVEWQSTHPDVEIVTVQKVDNGLFVVYKKKKEERIEKAVSNFGNKRK